MTAARPGLAADAWPGNTLITGGKGYVSTPMGQVHYRDVGPPSERPPILLLHQSQMSLIQYGQIQDALAALGWRSIAVDTPGHGMSDLPTFQPNIAHFADNLTPVLDALKLAPAVVAGHHSGTAIATSLAVRHPERVAALVLHGSVLFTPEEQAALEAGALYDRTPRADGSHMGAWFRPFPGDLPGDPATLRSRTWMMVSLFQMGPDVGKPAVFSYDMSSDARAVTQPALILTDEADGVHRLDLRLKALRPDFSYTVFSPGGAMTQMNEPERWARAVADFAEKTTTAAP